MNNNYNYSSFGKYLVAFMLLLGILSQSNKSSAQASSATWAGTSNLNAALSGNVTATAVTGGSSINTPAASTNGVAATSWTTSTSRSTTDYYEYTVSPGTNYAFLATSVSFSYLTSSSTWSGAVYYSLDGFNTSTQLGANYTPKTTSQNFSNSPSILVPAGSTLSVRVYAWNSGSSSRTFYCKSMVISGTAYSALSDIIVKSGYTYPQNIAYQNYQTTNITGGSSDIEIAKFTIRDGGSSTDADASSTVLNSITFSISNYADIRRIALYDGATELGEVAGASSVTFSGLSLTATDNSTKDFSVRVSFNSAVTDDDYIGLTVTAATASSTGSQFAADDAGGAATSVISNNNKIVVTSTKLVFGTQPSAVTVGAAISPAVTIKAEDANGNIDADYTSTVSLTSTGTFIGSATTAVAAISGIATFSNLVFSTAATNRTIAGTSGSLTATGNSSTFTISAFASVNTDYFQSKATGNWSSTSTWQSSHDNVNWYNATLTPDYNSSGVTIESPNVVTVTTGVTVDQVTVNSGGQVTINDGVTVTVNNGSSIDFDVSGTVQVIGTGSTGGSLSPNTGAIIQFENGGLYQHNFSSTSTQGSIPTATWSDGSTCEIIGFVSGTTIHVANLGQSFYNFTWNCPNQTGPYGMQGALSTVRGNLTIQSSGSTPQIVYGLGASSASFNLNIGGDFIINGGIFDFLNSGASGGPFSLTIGGSYTQTGGTFQSDYSGNGGLPIHFTGSGKTITKSAGTLTTSNMNFYVDNGASITLANSISISNSFTVSNGGTLYCGTNTFSGGGSFTLSAGGTLGIGSTAGITSSGSTGNVQTSSRSYGNANYIYDALSSGNTGNGLPASISSLTVSLGTSSSTLTLTNTSTLNISTSLILQTGILSTGTTEVDVNTTSTGSVSGYSTSSYVNGYLRRKVSTSGSYDFPVGSSSNYELVNINMKSYTGMTSIVVNFNTGLPATGPNAATCFIAGTPIANMLNAGYWTVSPDATPTAVDYDITLNESGYTNQPGFASNIGIIKRHSAANAWTGTNKTGGGFDGKQGNYSSGYQSISGGIASSKRSDVGGFSDYGIGYGGVPLPIELSSFNASVVNIAEVGLNWVTQSETNNNYFTIERSADGMHYDSIGLVQGAGNSATVQNYIFNDNSPLTNVSYYRLKQVDFDGNYTYSNIESVNIKMDEANITQQVVTGEGSVTSYITSDKSVSGNLQVVDNLGRVLVNRPVNISAGRTNEYINMDVFAPGIYFFVFQSSNQKLVTEFFFKP